MPNDAIPKPTKEQQEELARCYACCCGVTSADDLKGEMISARRQVKEWLTFWGRSKQQLEADAAITETPEEAYARGLLDGQKKRLA